jgi:hypothetical protein
LFCSSEKIGILRHRTGWHKRKLTELSPAVILANRGAATEVISPIPQIPLYLLSPNYRLFTVVFSDIINRIIGSD